MRSASTVTRLSLPVLLAGLAGCGPQGPSPDYLEACHGEPLSVVEQEEAMQEGYEIRPGYNCIDKASWAAVQAEKARWAAANTPEAKARRAAEQAAAHARASEASARRAAAEAAKPVAVPEPVVLRRVDVNLASEAELAAVITLNDEVAAQIVAARRERPFRDWADLTQRVIGLSQAQPAAFASVCGLTVNGESLLGAEPNVQFATQLRERYERYRRD